MLQPGDIVDNRFRVEALVGQGGLAEVYRVRHLALGSVHALKLLVWKKKSLARRLLLEGRIQAQLRHPNLVTVTDFLRHDGQFGLLMEYIEHETLEAWITRHGAMPWEQALTLIASVMSGVAAAHAVGVLHRDLKPANIMLLQSSSGLVPKVTDFGIAKVVQEQMDEDGNTAVGVTMGTPGYLAPEQVLDAKNIDQRADVFALGSILYELLTGRRAFQDASGEISVRATIEAKLTPLEQWVSDVPEHVRATICSALKREPDQRPDSIQALARGLFRNHPHLCERVEVSIPKGPLSLDTDQGFDQLPPGFGVTPAPSPRRDTILPAFDEISDASVVPGQSLVTGASDPRSGRRWGIGVLLGVAVVAVSLGVGGAGLLGIFLSSQRPPPAPTLMAAAPLPAVAVTAPKPALPDAIEVVASPSVAVVTNAEASSPADRPPPRALRAITRPSPAPPRAPVAAPPSATPTEVMTAEPVTPELVAPEALPPQPRDVVPVTAPEPPPAERPAPSLDASVLRGTWTGTANGRPLQLRLHPDPSGKLTGEATFYLGATQRSAPVQGRWDLHSGAVHFTASGLTFQGTLNDASLAGNYDRGGKGKSSAWSLRRQ